MSKGNINIIIEKFKLRLLKFLGVKYIKKGKCKKCGLCCKTIAFSINNQLIKNEEELARLKKFMPYRFNHFDISGIGDYSELLFRCKYLSEDNTCKVYNFRSFFCRGYPNFNNNFLNKGGKTFEDCGYYYEPIESFDDVYKKLI